MRLSQFYFSFVFAIAGRLLNVQRHIQEDFTLCGYVPFNQHSRDPLFTSAMLMINHPLCLVNLHVQVMTRELLYMLCKADMHILSSGCGQECPGAPGSCILSMSARWKSCMRIAFGR